MRQLDKVLYTARAHTVGGRAGGSSRTDDGRVDVAFSVPGGPGAGTNPEQLFAVGWSACFISAMQHAARLTKIPFPVGAADDVEVDLVSVDGVFSLRARHNITLPGLERGVAHELVEAADKLCPYSLATRGNIDVELNVV